MLQRNSNFFCMDEPTHSNTEKLQSATRENLQYVTPKNGGRNRIFQKNTPLQKFSFKYMESFLEKPVEEVVSKLSRNTHFFEHIGKNLTADYIVLILKLLARVCDFSFPALRRDMLHKSLTSGYVDQLQSYISTLAFQSDKEKRLNSYYWKDADSFWDDLKKICNVTMNENPHFFVDNLLKLVKLSLLNIPQIEEEHNVHLSDGIKNDLVLIRERANEIKTESPTDVITRRKELVDNSEEEPPEDFRDISIFPTTHELIHTKKTFLRKNVIIGPYKNVDHYLDVQFRLLREDFVGPLRLGIQWYLDGKQIRDIQDIKIHRRVQFLKTVVSTEDYCVLLNFHLGGKLRNFKYEDSKTFMFGSLVCFTNDEFKSIIFGRIVDREIENLKDGLLIVGFSKAEDLIFHSDYLMVECSIFFEPYYHVLNVLQQIREEDFPMKNYIVNVDKSVLMPLYADPLITLQIESNRNKENYNLFEAGFSHTFDDLNNSQNEAFIAALSRQLSIIQGPPGTGKTYVGLKIAQTLLENSHYWYDNSPILVICFTNHALDQFLEGLIDTTDEILRIGGQSKNEKLHKFNMKNNSHKMSPAVWDAKNNVTRCLNTIENVTDSLNQIANNDCIIDFHLFESIIPNFSDSWLNTATNRDFQNWLLANDIDEFKTDSKNDVEEPELSEVSFHIIKISFLHVNFRFLISILLLGVEISEDSFQFQIHIHTH